MKKTVKVRIEQKGERYVVSNEHGATWEYKLRNRPKDSTMHYGLAQLATSLLTATLGHAFSVADKEGNDIEFSLSMQMDERKQTRRAKP